MKESIDFFRKSEVVKYIAIMSFFTSAIISISLSISSAYFENILIPISLIGVLAFASAMLTAYTSKKADKWEDLLKEKKSIFLIQFSVILALILMSLMVPYFGFIFYFIIPFISGFQAIVLSNYVQNHLGTSHRATILSVKNMFGELGVFLFFPLVGYLTKTNGMDFAFLTFGLITFFGFLCLYIYSKDKKIEFNQNKNS